ncbi:MAG: hypothetical protein DDT25_01017 [Chloroflexi bacterium]|nr:hypothetical protein [Chloroflexota bacterium]
MTHTAATTPATMVTITLPLSVIPASGVFLPREAKLLGPTGPCGIGIEDGVMSAGGPIFRLPVDPEPPMICFRRVSGPTKGRIGIASLNLNLFYCPSEVS